MRLHDRSRGREVLHLGMVSCECPFDSIQGVVRSSGVSIFFARPGAKQGQ